MTGDHRYYGTTYSQTRGLNVTRNSKISLTVTSSSLSSHLSPFPRRDRCFSQAPMAVDPRHHLFAELTLMEKRWSAREELLNAHGYKLRPRLRKDWTPSWLTNGKSPHDCEDAELLPVWIARCDSPLLTTRPDAPRRCLHRGR